MRSDLWRQIVDPLIDYVRRHEMNTGRRAYVEVAIAPDIYDVLACEAAWSMLTTVVLDVAAERMIIPPTFMPYPTVLISRGIP